MQICIYQKDNPPKSVNHCLTLKEGPNANSDHIIRFPAHDFLQVGFILQTSMTNNKQVISTFKFGYPHLTLKGTIPVSMFVISICSSVITVNQVYEKQDHCRGIIYLFRDINNFSFSAKIQDGRQKW